jgi:iron(III) transport system permease protein
MPPLSEISAAAASSVGLSLGGAAVTVALATPVGLLVARYGDRLLPRLLERATYVGHALPGIVVALSLVFLSVRVFFGLYQTALLVILAYAVLFLPLAVGAVRSSAAQAPPALEDVARSLGRGPFEVLRTITLPLVTPGIAAGAALVFLTCMKELPATLLLRPTGVDTLATELWTETGVGAFAAAAPYAALLVLLSAVPTYLVSRRTGGWLRAAEMSARADEAA